MKKLHILIPSLVATASMPFIGLVGCNPEKPSGYHTITFHTNCTGTIPQMSVKDNEVAIEPKEPANPGFVLEGGYIDEELTSSFDGSTKVTHDYDLYAKGVSTPEPEAKSFNSDPGETVCYYANQGLDKLCDAYQTTPKQLLGQTRDITINNKVHKVKVIGTNEDVYQIDEASYFSALTFQFDTLITDANGQLIKCKGDSDNDAEHYWSSDIHQMLNDETSQDITSIYEMLVANNPGAKQYLRSSYRWVNTKDNFNGKIKVGTEKLFLPVLSDLFSVSGLEATDSSIIGEGNIAQYYYENVRGSQYSYYQISKNIGNSYIAAPETSNATYKQFSCLKKEQNYGLCSPYLSGSSYAGYVDSDGCVRYGDTPEMAATLMCLAPCFCI